MPDLPTISVTPAQATRIIAAFGDAAGYRTWLKEAVRNAVINKEISDLHTQAEQAQADRVNEIMTEIPD